MRILVLTIPEGSLRTELHNPVLSCSDPVLPAGWTDQDIHYDFLPDAVVFAPESDTGSDMESLMRYMRGSY